MYYIKNYGEVIRELKELQILVEKIEELAGAEKYKMIADNYCLREKENL